MDHRDFKLDQQTHDEVYAEIERDAFDRTQEVDHPRVIITGGQPGSGKSKLLEDSKQDFPDHNVVVINGDEYRRNHPQKEDMFKIDDKRFAELTDADCRVWTKKLFDRTIETHRNIVFESTMRDPGPISETMQRLKKEGYEIMARVVATHERYSKTGIFRRYEEQKAAGGYGRWTPQASHDAGYVGLLKTVEHIETNKLIDRIEVFDRRGRLLYRNELQQGQWQNQPEAVKVIETERQREPSETERQHFRIDWERIYRLMEVRKAPLREMEQARKVHQKLERELNMEPGREHDRAR